MIAVLARAFYARQDTVTPVAAAVGAVIVNSTLAVILVDPFGLPGIALAIAIAAWVEALVLMAILHGRLAHFRLRGMAGSASSRSRAARSPGVAAWWLLQRAGDALGPEPGRLDLARPAGGRERRVRRGLRARLGCLADTGTAVYRRGHGRRLPPSGAIVTAAEDAAAWDRFVETQEPGSYMQRTEWAAVKAVNGWTAHRVVADAGRADRIGAQILVRRPRPMPWGFAYAPRGPVATTWPAASIGRSRPPSATTCRRRRPGVARPDRSRDRGRTGRSTSTGRFVARLRVAGWRPATPIQPNATRIIDLRADEAALWGDLRKKWRQYVNKARTAGVEVVDADGDRLSEFYRVYRETADRAGFLIRAESAYRDVWDAFSPSGNARLLFAQKADGEPLATLFLVSCGPRVVEPYGGMTAAGGESRANYLLKWEAIRSSRERGATSYDLWGLATGGIAHFKTGFGGREVRYVGAWDLVLIRSGRRAYEGAQRGRVWWARRRSGLAGGGSAAAYTGAD